MGEAAPGARKIDRGTPRIGCPVERDADGVWRVSGYEEARAVLRSTATVQAGFRIEAVEKLPSRIRRPVLFRDGPEHREHRRQTARYFAPRRVNEQYREVMVRVAEALIAALRADGEAQLSELSFRLAIEVAAAVVGLTESRPGIRRRLERFFPEESGTPGFTSVEGLRWMVRENVNWLRIYLADVRPAVRVRRARRRDDLISHLLDEGCSSGEILGECLTIAAAGMITTREFINVAAWHLFTDDALRRRYTTGDEAGRIALLHEILRLEPVAAALKRRTTAPLEIPTADGTVTVPPGERVEVLLAGANLDPRTFGPSADRLCPHPPPGAGGAPGGLSFGDGPHKCPGAGIAILETDVFLSRLFAEPGLRMRTGPTVSLRDVIDGYELRGLTVTLDAP